MDRPNLKMAQHGAPVAHILQQQGTGHTPKGVAAVVGENTHSPMTTFSAGTDFVVGAAVLLATLAGALVILSFLIA